MTEYRIDIDEWLERRTLEDGREVYRLKDELPVLNLGTIQEQCAYLVQLIRKWTRFVVEKYNASAGNIQVDYPFCGFYNRSYHFFASSNIVHLLFVSVVLFKLEYKFNNLSSSNYYKKNNQFLNKNKFYLYCTIIFFF